LIGDWLYFLYTTLNGISKYKLNMGSLIELNSYRALNLGKWISSETGSIDFSVELKKSCVFQAVCELDGMISFRYYKNAVPDDAPRYQVTDYIQHPKFREDTDQCFRVVAGTAGYLPYNTTYKWERESVSKQSEWNHRKTEKLTVDTVLRHSFQLRDLLDNYLSMHKNPPEIIDGLVLPTNALMLNPTDKFYLTYVLKDDDGEEVTIYEDEVFRVLGLEKDLNSGHVTVRAVKDIADFNWTIGPE